MSYSACFSTEWTQHSVSFPHFPHTRWKRPYSSQLKKFSEDLSPREELGLHLLRWNYPWENKAARVTFRSHRIGPRPRLPAFGPWPRPWRRLGAEAAAESGPPGLGARCPSPCYRARGPIRPAGLRGRVHRGLPRAGSLKAGRPESWELVCVLLSSNYILEKCGDLGVIGKALVKDLKKTQQQQQKKNREKSPNKRNPRILHLSPWGEFGLLLSSGWTNFQGIKLTSNISN